MPGRISELLRLSEERICCRWARTHIRLSLPKSHDQQIQRVDWELHGDPYRARDMYGVHGLLGTRIQGRSLRKILIAHFIDLFRIPAGMTTKLIGSVILTFTEPT